MNREQKIFDKASITALVLGVPIGCFIAYHIQYTLKFFGANFITVNTIITTWILSVLASFIFIALLSSYVLLKIQSHRAFKKAVAERKAKDAERQTKQEMTVEEFKEHLYKDVPIFTSPLFTNLLEDIMKELVKSKANGKTYTSYESKQFNQSLIKHPDYYAFKKFFSDKEIEFRAKISHSNSDFYFRQ